MKIMICVNTFAPINQFVYSNHMGLFTHTIQWFLQKKALEIHDDLMKMLENDDNGIEVNSSREEFIEKVAELRQINSEIKLYLHTPHRSSIDRVRNGAAVMAMQLDCDYLLFLDDDVLTPIDAIIKLAAAKQDIIAGLVVIRGEPFNLMAFQNVSPDEAKEGKSGFKNEVVKIADETGESIQPVNATGFSLCLIDMNIIRKMEPPYFITGPNHTEDTFFCKKAEIMTKGAVKIAVDTSIRCGHMMMAEPIEYDTIQLFKDFYAGVRKLKELPAIPRHDRNEDLVARTLQILG